MFVICVNYIKPLGEVERFLQEHVVFLDKYYANGTFICSGRRNPRTGGIILAKGSDQSALKELIKEDPFWINGIAEYEIIEFYPTKYSEQFKAIAV